PVTAMRDRLLFRRFPKIGAMFLAASAGALPMVWATPAAADFTVCNLTASTVGLAIGYRDGDTLVTEGWWTLPPPRGGEQSCVTPDALAGPLQQRYYYIYAVDYTLGGEWAGGTFMCTSDRAFTI